MYQYQYLSYLQTYTVKLDLTRKGSISADIALPSCHTVGALGLLERKLTTTTHPCTLAAASSKDWDSCHSTLS